MNEIIDALFRSSIFKRLATRYMGKVALTGEGSNQCLELGYLPLPIHYYSPIPDLKDLAKRKIWDKKSSLSGINFNENTQIRLLLRLGKKYGKECQWPKDLIVNNSFSYSCAASLYCMIKNFNPKRIIEIGSGRSSEIILKTISQTTDYKIVDPFPEKKFPGLIRKPVQSIKLDFFKSLKRNDILFIDSSHSAKTGSDVNFLILDVLPILNSGVIVHFHDIALPYEYPKVYFVNPAFRQFWTEQYLLQAFLSGNKQYEILLAMNFLMANHLSKFKRAFKYYDSNIHINNSGSFWIRKKI